MRTKKIQICLREWRRYGALIPCINHNHVPLYLTSDIKMCFCLSLQIGFLPASAPVIPQIERMMNKILLKALRCFIMSDKLLCGKNSDKKRLSLYHQIKNILIRSWEYSWFKQNIPPILNLYFEQWGGEIFDQDKSIVQSTIWCEKCKDDLSMNQTQWGRKFLTSWLFFVLIWSYQPRSDLCYLIKLIIWHLGHPSWAEQN